MLHLQFGLRRDVPPASANQRAAPRDAEQSIPVEDDSRNRRASWGGINYGTSAAGEAFAEPSDSKMRSAPREIRESAAFRPSSLAAIAVAAGEDSRVAMSSEPSGRMTMASRIT